MKLWSDFYNETVPDLPGCPLVMLSHAIRNAAILFCEQSRAWRYAHPDIAVMADQDEYPYDPPAETSVHEVCYAEFNDQEISWQTNEPRENVWNWRHQTGTPMYILGGPTTFSLIPKPNLEGTLKLVVVLKPSYNATGIDDDIFNEYHEAIAHGAKARLMLSPRKPYTNAELSAYHMQQFTILAGAASVRVARNYSRAPLQTPIMRRR